jgi:hypothetical protein
MHPIIGSNVRDFILGGKALFTVENQTTGKRFTFKVRQKTNPDGTLTPHFVSVLVGPDNTKNYAFLGCVFNKQVFRHGRKSKLSIEDQRVKAFAWIFENSNNLPQNIVVYHHGRCGKCGRLLTVPESIKSGLGPKCRGAS